jgi:hypothetical protein
MLKIKIIDNFLDTEDLNILVNSINQENTNQIKVFHNSIDSKNQILASSLEKNFILNLQKKYFPRAIKLLEELSPKKVKLYDYSDFTLVLTDKNKKFPIHDDTPDKLLSGVIYLHPQENTGTKFYDNRKGDNERLIDWKINRGVFFSRIERESWHSYESNGIKNRLTLIFNLKTYNIKEVYNIEKKNFFLGNLRYKINPYIYKFFEKTI